MAERADWKLYKLGNHSVPTFSKQPLCQRNKALSVLNGVRDSVDGGNSVAMEAHREESMGGLYFAKMIPHRRHSSSPSCSNPHLGQETAVVESWDEDWSFTIQTVFQSRRRRKRILKSDHRAFWLGRFASLRSRMNACNI